MTQEVKGPGPIWSPDCLMESSRRVTIQLVDNAAGASTGGPQPFRGQSYQAIRAACLESGTLFRDPCFPAGPDALGYDKLGPDSEKAKGVEWKRPHVKWGWSGGGGWGLDPWVWGRRLGPGPLGLREDSGAWTPGSGGGGWGLDPWVWGRRLGPGPLGVGEEAGAWISESAEGSPCPGSQPAGSDI
jgi:hypothetical protein